MTKKKANRKKPKPPTKEDLLRLEIAEELGLGDKIRKYGWGSLNAKEAGRIGGIITQRIKKGLITDYKAKNH
ncbi:small, acid-soluble spore protein, alpha/beta type [Desulfofalx alkaliphila]|uniref:small, acid-soluble spore protein, alpha/beta type n=1 Tax=Desulfofalx alkaliphila TaxID=105483 RepID=UPI0004E1B118|nr:small, acid-soluble spore protein, alpha/beta type [Desulfofalx alkaliphila]